MKYSFFFVLVVGLVSCASYQNTQHSFTYHGTDNLGLDQNFFYVSYGVQGTSNTSYKYRGNGDFLGGDVRAGLVADAKSDLIDQHPLEPNQAYANLSVDVMRTEKGELNGTGVVDLESVTLTAVITADVIEYGTPPDGYKLPVKKRGLSTSSTSQVQESQESDLSRAQEPNEEPYSFAEGDAVLLEFQGVQVEGVVEDTIDFTGSVQYRVRFDHNGKSKAKWFFEQKLRKKLETNE